MTSSSPAAPDLPPPERAAYLLDFDGTLVDIAPTPEQVAVDPDLPGDLRALRTRADGAVAIVTGRPIAQIDALLGDAVTAIAGEHGAALRRTPGAAPEATHMPPVPLHWLAAAAALATNHPGTRLETKPHGFALHYRAAPEHGPALSAGLRSLIAGQARDYELLAAKMAWEIRPAGVSKATAVHAIMSQPPFAGRVPVFVGDDVTDEDGMAAARLLGGVGLRVPDVFASPLEVRAWIAVLAGRKQGLLF